MERKITHMANSNGNTRTERINVKSYQEIKDEGLPHPSNPLVSPLLTDMYQLTMAYGYWKSQIHDRRAVFDLFFRHCPFKGQFCIFAGLSEVLKFVGNFGFTDQEIDYLRRVMQDCDPDFFDYLRTLNCDDLEIHAFKEGTICFAREPIIRVSGPLAVCQLIETTLLTLVGFPSLVATQACRMKMLAGEDKVLLEFGLRRAQGADGGCSASYYACLGGFNATSNMQTGYMHNVVVKGTHAHSFVQTFMSFEQIKNPLLKSKKSNKEENLVENVQRYRNELDYNDTNTGELVAFIAYALAFPNGFLALIDTYDTLHSGNKNFILVALALHDMGYIPIGVRLDSGDLAMLSKEIKATWRMLSREMEKPFLSELKVVASNDINERTLRYLNQQGHEIDIFGIGTHLATCQKQPALGCVYKLAEVDGYYRMKISNDYEKVTIPGTKDVYRLYSSKRKALLDLMVAPNHAKPRDGEEKGEAKPEEESKFSEETIPADHRRVLCINPHDPTKRVWVNPSTVEKLHVLHWAEGELKERLPTLDECKERVSSQLATIEEEYLTVEPQDSRQDELKQDNESQAYKVSVSGYLHNEMKKLWERESPIRELS